MYGINCNIFQVFLNMLEYTSNVSTIDTLFHWNKVSIVDTSFKFFPAKLNIFLTHIIVNVCIISTVGVGRRLVLETRANRGRVFRSDV